MAYSTQYGASRSKFGAADYAAALYPHRRDTAALQTTRESVLSWLTGAGASTLGPTQGPGMAGGLYERIRTPELTPWWGDHTLDRKTRFGHSDLDASRAAGFSDLAIQSYLDANPTLLSSDNVPGAAGGVYDIVAGETTDNRPRLSDWTNITETNDTVIERDREGRTITRDDPARLTINPGQSTVSKRALGDISRRRPATARPKYTKTKDLNRKTRSLTISSY